jgi:predicted component of type VI protein secretion system
MTLILVVQSEGKWQGRTLAIAQFPFLIGRGSECQLRPNSNLVSRRQCGLVSREERYFLEDFGSTNGTLLNGRILRGGEIELLDGDLVTVGPLEFLVQIPEQVAADGDDEAPAASQDANDPEATWANMLLAAPDVETVPEAPGIQAGDNAEDPTEVGEPPVNPEEARPVRPKAPRGDAQPGTPGHIAKQLLKKYRQSRRGDEE